jgi:transcriptional repressor NrdR
MKCPYCSHIKTKVTDKRQTKDSTNIRRRRECLKCKKRFTTYETPASMGLVVIKKDGRKQPYQREKIESGFLKACEKRPVSKEKIQQIINNIEAQLKRRGKKEIKSSIIGNLVSKELKKLDKVAYLRFASVYRDFENIKDFKQEIKEL